jgi:hypothetical protein
MTKKKKEPDPKDKPVLRCQLAAAHDDPRRKTSGPTMARKQAKDNKKQ